MIWEEEEFLWSDRDVGYISYTLMGSRPYRKIVLVCVWVEMDDEAVLGSDKKA